MSTPEPAATARTHGALAIVLLLLLAWGGLYIWRTSFEHEGERVFCLWDDAMISMRYARNLVEGRGLVWNLGERVQGYTNPAVTLVMAGIHLLPLDDLRTSLPFQLLNLVLLAACVVLVWRITRRLAGDHRVAAAAALATALCAPLAVWSLQGSDVGFVTCWLLFCCDRVIARRDSAAPWPWSLLLVLSSGVWIRPDVALLAGLLWVGTLGWPGDRWRRALRWAAVQAALGGALLLFGWLYYGDPLPNTFYLKATGAPLDSVLASGVRQLDFWLPFGPVAVLPAALAVALRFRERGVALLGALCVGAVCYNMVVGGDWVASRGSRFVVPVLPLVLVLAALGFAASARRLARVWRGDGPVLAGSLLTALAALALGPPPACREWLRPDRPTMFRRDNERNVRLALYLREHAQPDTSIAVHWAGVPPYFSRLFAIDVLGRSDRHIARRPIQPTLRSFRPGHSKWDWEYVVEQRKPDIVLRVDRGVQRWAVFRELYLRAVHSDEIYFWVRRTSLHKLRDPKLELWSYPASVDG